MPPAIPGTINGIAKVAITGPIYGFDPSLDSPVKFPPHLDEHWFTFDFSGNKVWIHSLDDSGRVTKTQQVDQPGGIFTKIRFRKPLAARFGPEGALYINNYAGFFSTTNETQHHQNRIPWQL